MRFSASLRQMAAPSVTLNRRHFIRLHESGRAHYGLIVCTFNPDFTEQAEQIDEELRRCTELRQTLVRVNRPDRQT